MILPIKETEMSYSVIYFEGLYKEITLCALCTIGFKKPHQEHCNKIIKPKICFLLQEFEYSKVLSNIELFINIYFLLCGDIVS